MLRIKICGITNLEDALLAAAQGAHALGFVFYPPSPRYVTPEAAWRIIAQLPPLVLTVGVFVDAQAEVVEHLAELVGLDWVQLHGSEPPQYCQDLGHRVIKAFRIQNENSLTALADYQGAAQAFLLDAYKPEVPGGTGEAFDWNLAREAQTYGPVILSGGLTAENVAQAIKVAEPLAVDVASGVEAAPGKKDPKKLAAFFRAIREVERRGLKVAGPDPLPPKPPTPIS
jgi:phosphoribosylanthranilate isomerase